MVQRLVILYVMVSVLWLPVMASMPGGYALTIWSPIYQAGVKFYNDNPAAQTAVDSVSWTRVDLSGSYVNSDEPVVVQEGDGKRMFSINGISYTRLGGAAAVMGGASYRTGTTRNVRWNNAADYNRVFPYVAGDSVGGNLTCHEYTFGGNVGVTIGSWALGAGADYRASIDYRNRDPRVKDVVSDMTLRVGGARRALSRYFIGVAGRFNIYNQDSDVDFYNPVNDIVTVLSTGLGTSYHRFNGSASDQVAYSSTGGGISLSLFPEVANSNGWRFVIDADCEKMSVRLRALNNITPCRLENWTASFKGSYIVVSSQSIMWMPVIDINWTRRIGTETLYGTATGNSFPEISRRQFYYNDRLKASASVMMSIDVRRAGVFTLCPSYTFMRNDEFYHSPRRQLRYDRSTFAFDLDWRKPVSQIVLKATAGVAYCFATDKYSRLDQLDINRSIDNAVLHNYYMATADRGKIAVSAGIMKPLDKSFIIAIDLKGYKDFYKKYGDETFLQACVSLCF